MTTKRPLALIIEDDRDLSRLYVMLFNMTNVNLETETCFDGTHALERVKQSPEPRFIVLDLHLPHVDGEVILEEAKRNYPNSLIIIVSADVVAVDKLRRARAADLVLSKPLDVAFFMDFVRNNMSVRVPTQAGSY